METESRRLVGRTAERAAIERSLDALAEGRGGMVAVEGEPGIGKSALLAELSALAEARGFVALGARASELEGDLPYAIWTEALDRHLADAGERRIAHLGLADAAALAVLLPSVAGEEAAAGDRHRTHRALRDLLERLAVPRPVVVCLDDLHWADPASAEALAALLRRPPAGAVLLALASRTGQAPAAVSLAIAGALRDGRATALTLTPLSRDEATALVGGAAAALYESSGGNPFYLEQLARAAAAPAPVATANLGGSGDRGVPPAVAAALATELAALEPAERRLLDAGAVAGDPFELGVAVEVAELGEAESLAALDGLLARTLVREAGAPRRFAFRHPVVRHAVYEMAPAGRRLGAHARADAALERRGAGTVARARHVAVAAEPGDERAVELLSGAAAALASPAPASAARFYAAALRLLPDRGDGRRARIQALLSDAQAAAGDPEAARATLLDALRTADPAQRLRLVVAVANSEWWLGRHADAHRRLHLALAELPAEPSLDRVRLRLALCLTAFGERDMAEAAAQAGDARDDARALGDPAFEAAALAAGTLANVAAQRSGTAAWLAAAEAALERLDADVLATRLVALWMLGRSHNLTGRPAAALGQLRRGLALAAGTGRERVRVHLTVESVASLAELGRVEEAVAVGEEGVERARLARNPGILLWAHSALSSALLVAGDVEAALGQAREAAGLGAPAGLEGAGQPGWCLGDALVAAGEPAAGAAELERALAATIPAQRPSLSADLVRARLAAGDLDGAERALAPGEDAATMLARAELLLARDRAVEAATAARRAATSATELGVTRARLLEGRALAAAGRRAEAVEALLAAEAVLDRFGARRERDVAVRELRRLGRRVVRAAPPGEGDGVATLTAREREIAGLVAAGRSNREIAAQLVLSTRTIDAHLRNIYAKLGVRSRVELTRSVRG